ncbi:response regulator [Stakelama sp. CBK3Z-3]|uniref:Response regulator n=1 Tax=Stakelama flava TaxID=2860338 RepID=A0ABS6XRF1_9SPHN|nr:response regulator [Stakelama flava]MBW4331981.1 response regulator [Stakelama flava]
MRILYVDDDPDLRDIAEWALEARDDIDLRMADSGEAAIAMIDDGGWLPHLIVLDARMPPGLDGPQTLALLRTRAALGETRFAFVTAAREEERDQLAALQVDAVLAKPFDPATFADTLAGIVAKSPDSNP